MPPETLTKTLKTLPKFFSPGIRNWKEKNQEIFSPLPLHIQTKKAVWKKNRQVFCIGPTIYAQVLQKKLHNFSQIKGFFKISSGHIECSFDNPIELLCQVTLKRSLSVREHLFEFFSKNTLFLWNSPLESKSAVCKTMQESRCHNPKISSIPQAFSNFYLKKYSFSRKSYLNM